MTVDPADRAKETRATEKEQEMTKSHGRMYYAAAAFFVANGVVWFSEIGNHEPNGLIAGLAFGGAVFCALLALIPHPAAAPPPSSPEAKT